LGLGHLDIVLGAHPQLCDFLHVLEPIEYLEGRRRYPQRLHKPPQQDNLLSRLARISVFVGLDKKLVESTDHLLLVEGRDVKEVVCNPIVNRKALDIQMQDSTNLIVCSWQRLFSHQNAILQSEIWVRKSVVEANKLQRVC
jgi:hypothetical protein